VKKDVKIIIKASLTNDGRTRVTISHEDLEGLNHEERKRFIDELAEVKTLLADLGRFFDEGSPRRAQLGWAEVDLSVIEETR